MKAISRGWSKRWLVEPLHDHGHPLAAADAHRLQPERFVLLAKSVEQRAKNARAGHAEGMAERDRAAVGVELLAVRVDTQASRGRDDLRGKRLLDLDEVDVVDGHLGALERLPRRVDRAQAHELGLERRQAGGDHAGQRLDAELPGLAL